MHEEPRHNPEPYAGRSLLDWLSDSENFRSFMNALYARRRMMERARGDSTKVPKQAGQYLVTCCEKVLDAHTIEDAIYWHSEIITELAVEIHSISAMQWPATVKASMTAALEDRVVQHSAVINRLSDIVLREQQLTWRP